jgi:hypothetical protein
MMPDTTVRFVNQLPFKRDVPGSPFTAIGSNSGAIGRHRTFNGRGFFSGRNDNIRIHRCSRRFACVVRAL